MLPNHIYSSEEYQSVGIYQTKNRLLSWYYWGRVTTTISMLLGQLGQSRGDRVLDLGCGSGMTLPTLQRYFAEVTAADVYTEHAAKVKKFEGLAGLELVTCDGRMLPFRSGSFDAVLMMDILEHVEGSKRDLIAESHRVLRRGGHIACSFPVEIGPAILLRQIGRRFFGLEGNRQGFRETLRHALGHTNATPTGEPPTHATTHDEAHRGYDYTKDLSLLKEYFGIAASSPVPFGHAKILSPAFVIIGRSRKKY